MSGQLYDEDGIDGPFNRAMDEAMREDDALIKAIEAGIVCVAMIRHGASHAPEYAIKAAHFAHMAGVGR